MRLHELDTTIQSERIQLVHRLARGKGIPKQDYTVYVGPAWETTLLRHSTMEWYEMEIEEQATYWVRCQLVKQER